ncbi:MAG: PAS domain S-box protein [Planctomycetes bacterium]|nr:PAS domain S-box protein [Planctomycetota bacterium]
MVKKRKSESENLETARESHSRQKQPNLVPAGRPPSENLANINEQLRTEVEELRRQVLELQELKHLDEGSIWGAEWLARIADENPDPVLQVSQRGVIRYRNPASFSLCRRWNPDDEMVVPSAIHKIAAVARATTKVIRQEMMIGDHTYLITVAPAPAPAGYVNIYTRDITERKRAEEELRSSQEKLALAASGTQIGMYDRDAATGEIRGTEQMARLLGLRTTTTLSQVYHYHDWAERVHAEDLPRVEAELRRCQVDHSPCEAEYRVLWPDGSVHWVIDRGVFQYEPEDQPTHLLGIVMDITARRQSEADLRRLATVVLDSNDAVTLQDLDGHILAWNRGAELMYGYSAREALQMNIEVLVPPGARAQARSFLDAIQRGDEVVSLEVQRQTKDGRILDVWLTTTKLVDNEGHPVAMATTERDITRRKQAEEALRELTTTLEGKVTQRTAELRQRTRQLQKLALEMSETEDRERERLAHVLHDDLQQELAAAKFHLSIVRSRVKYDPSVQEIITTVDEMLKDAIGKSRSLSHELSPAALRESELAEILRWLTITKSCGRAWLRFWAKKRGSRSSARRPTVARRWTWPVSFIPMWS